MFRLFIYYRSASLSLRVSAQPSHYSMPKAAQVRV